jgi:hypothetical protein
MLGNRTRADNSAYCIILMSGGCHEEQSFIVMGHYAITFRLLFKNFSPDSKVLGLKADIKTNSYTRCICHNKKTEHINAKQWIHGDRTNRQFGRSQRTMEFYKTKRS